MVYKVCENNSSNQKIHLFFSDISGERLWVELKRIAEGRNAGPVLKLMLEQDTARYLGIPSDADLNALEAHWRNCHQSHPHALTILIKLFRNMEEVLTEENSPFEKSLSPFI